MPTMQCSIDARKNGIYDQYINAFNNAGAYHVVVNRDAATMQWPIYEFRVQYTAGYGRNMLRFLVCDTTTLEINHITAVKEDFPDKYDDVTEMFFTTYQLDLNTITEVNNSNQLDFYAYPVGKYYQFGNVRFDCCAATPAYKTRKFEEMTDDDGAQSMISEPISKLAKYR